MTTDAGTPDLSTFNPFDPDTLQCPFPHYAAMRERAPVHEVAGLGMFLVTRHDLVLEVVRDPELYSNQFGQTAMPLPEQDRARMAEAVAEGYPRVPTMLTADPPDHTRYRRLVTKAFTPKVIAAMEPTIRAITTRLLDACLVRGSVEFVEAFAVPLPVEVIAKVLNVPDSRLADFKRWSDDSIAGIGTNLDLEGRIAAERGVNEFQRYFAEQLELRRTDPQDDVLTDLLNARVSAAEDGIDDDRPLDIPEMLSILQQILVAGNETTTKMLTEMVRLLAEHPDEWRRVQDDPSRVDRVVEETLRLATPTQGMFRIVTRDTRLGDVDLPAGSRVVAVYCSANRDETLFADPDGFDPDRENLREHLAFGKGIHFCLGAALSRLEGRVALQELARRVDTIRLADDNDFRYFPSFMLRGLTSLDVELTARDGVGTVTGSLAGKVAVVTGSSRGIGRGTAIALGEHGARVYVTGRTTGSGELTIDTTAELVTAAGGHGIAVATDHGDDAQIGDLFARVGAEQGHLDVLVNNVYKIPDPPAWGGGFWDHPISVWDDQVGIGLRAHYVASWHAAPLLFAAGPGGVIVNVSSPGGQSYHFSSSYGAGKAGLDRLGADMAIELAPKGIACCTVYPGSVATEFIKAWAAERGTDVSGAQTPLGVGRAIAALVTAPDVMDRTGSIQWVEDLGVEFDVRDEDGRLPAPYANRAPR